ncbi:MAG: 5'/3'-nucleotidase SurE [Cyanobacteria bacterium P01_C01_bin.121]
MSLFVLTNDDGIDAPGIQALRAAVDDIGTSVVVAPDSHLSGCSHQINRGGAIAINQRSGTDYAIGGTPADCSRVAISHLYPDANWVLSGINAGGNLGSDTYVSGTVAAVREATLLRKQGIAISQYRYRSAPYDWERATRLTAKVLRKLMATELKPGEFWNVNLPAAQTALTDVQNSAKDEPEIVFCEQCTQPLPTEFLVDETGFRYTGAYENRSRDAGADVDVCFSGNISVVKVRMW